MRVQMKLMIRNRLGISDQIEILTYLGVSIMGQRLRRADYRYMEQQIQNHLDDQQTNALSMMDRTIFVRSVLSSISIYLMVNIVVPCSFLRSLQQQFQNFLWGTRQGGRGLHLLFQEVVCQSVRNGGLGIQSLLVRREAMIYRHATRFLIQSDCLWSRVMGAHYGTWSQGSHIRIDRSCSFIWGEICTRAPAAVA